MRERVAEELLRHANSRTTRELHTYVSERMMDQAVQTVANAVDRVVTDATDPEQAHDRMAWRRPSESGVGLHERTCQGNRRNGTCTGGVYVVRV